MKNKGVLWLMAAMVMLLVVVLYNLLANNGWMWYPRLDPDGKQPYDVSVFKKLLAKNVSEADFTTLIKPYHESLKEGKGQNLVVIKPYFYPDTAEIRALNKFIRRGNHVFICTENLSPLLPMALRFGSDSVADFIELVQTENLFYRIPDSLEQQYDETETREGMDSLHQHFQEVMRIKAWKNGLLDTAISGKTARLRGMDGTTVRLAYQNPYDTLFWYWKGVAVQNIPNGTATVVYDTATLPAALATWPLGDGQLTLCSTPIIYTNYYFTQRQNFVFANQTLTNFKNGPILWDEVERYGTDFDFRPKGTLSDSPLSFIMSQLSLRWAWFTLLGAVLLFVMFRSKRRQRIIPIKKPNNNTTLAYARLLGSLQLKEKDNATKGTEVYQHFLQHLRARYRWPAGLENDDLKERLLKIAPDLTREIQVVLHIGSIATKRQPISDEQLVNLFNYTNLIIQRT